MENNEKIIVEQLKSGNENAYKYLYDQHYVLLCHVAYEYLHDYFLAETIVGDTIFHLWEIRESLEISSSLRCYLTRAVRNRCLNYLKEEHQRAIPLSMLGSEDALQEKYLVSGNYPLGSLLEHELEKEIHDSIERLPEDCRRVFKKSRFEEKKYEEIASELDISVNTVKYHIKNALSRLQADLSKYLITLLLFFLK